MHLMVDFETLDTTPTTVLVSAGAVFFNNRKVLKSAYWELELDSQLAAGRTVREDTLRWWFSQSKEAQAPLHPKGPQEKENMVDLAEFVQDFLLFCELAINDHKTNWKGVNIWGNGASFDVPIIEDILRSQGRAIPWAFWNIVCFRTFNKLTKCLKLIEREGVHHNAMDDAIYQAETCIAYWESKGHTK